MTSDSLPLPAGPGPPLFPGRKSHPVPGGAGLHWKERLAQQRKAIPQAPLPLRCSWEYLPPPPHPSLGGPSSRRWGDIRLTTHGAATEPPQPLGTAGRGQPSPPTGREEWGHS